MKDKYYRVSFKNDEKKLDRFYLYEYKKLSKEEYHSSLMLKRKQVKKLQDSKKEVTASDLERLTYDGYSLKKFNYFIRNNSKLDGFDYDKYKELKVYGSTSFYVMKADNGKYIDIATGISMYFFDDIIELVEVKDENELNQMRNDMFFICKNYDLYRRALYSVSSKINWEYIKRTEVILEHPINRNKIKVKK